MKKSILILGLLISLSLFSEAQASTEEAKVSKAMLDYIEGFYEGDSSKIINSISPEVVKYGYWKNKNTGKYDGEAMTYKEMIDYAVDTKAKQKQTKPGTIKEVLVFEVQDQTASGKITAWWGTDYILLEKTNNIWMIRLVLWQGPLSTITK